LGVAELPDVVGIVCNHCETLHAKAEVHDRDPDTVFGKCRGGVHSEGCHFDPPVDRVPGIDLSLGVRHVILGAFLIRLEAEVRVTECGEERFSLVEGNIVASNDTGRGVVGHESRGTFCLLAAETAVN
jgi:hypothetical protein